VWTIQFAFGFRLEPSLARVLEDEGTLGRL
jgi:hypothetical protein